MKKLLFICLMSAGSVALAESSLVGTWKTTSVKCERSGVLINGFDGQRETLKLITLYPDGVWTMYSDSADNTLVSGRGTYRLRGNLLHTDLSEVTVNGTPQTIAESKDVNFRLRGDKLTTSHRITQGDGPCPAGDSAISEMVRVSGESGLSASEADARR